MISIIVPTLDEIDRIETCLLRLRAQAPEAEIIVVDGGSTDGTDEVVASTPGVTLVRAARPGRGSQLAAGARHACGDVLTFLHADTRLDDGWPRALEAVLAEPDVAAGAFRYRIEGEPWPYRIVELGVGLRARLFQLPYGDQGLFMVRSMYDRVKGYRNQPLMEDVDIVGRLRREGRVVLARSRAHTSPRTWQRTGVALGVLRNWTLVMLYRLGVPASRLARYYTGRAVDEGEPS